MGRDWLHDRCGSAHVWRTRRDDAQSRWTICLPARVTWAALGISLWVVDVPRNSNRNHCRGGRGVRKISRCSLPRHLCRQMALAYRAYPKMDHWCPRARKHGCRPQLAEPGRHRNCCAAYRHQRAWSAHWRISAEHLHVFQDCCAVWLGAARGCSRT